MTLHPCEDPARRCLKVEDWPGEDRAAWNAIFTEGDLLEGDAGPGAHWSAATREFRRKGYGRWLNFLIVTDRLDRSTPPAAR
ncbi:MAG: hypothetical protein AAFR01_07255, partial [Pseudomonadota bacterium]